MLRRAPVVLAAIVAAAIGGCEDEGVTALESTRDRVCKCHDATCVNAAMDAMADRPTRRQRKAESVAREIVECIARVYQASDARPVEDELGGDVTAP